MNEKLRVSDAVRELLEVDADIPELRPNLSIMWAKDETLDVLVLDLSHSKGQNRVEVLVDAMNAISGALQAELGHKNMHTGYHDGVFKT